MHELEEGNLAWGDSTQLALNRLSASQVSMINSQSVSQKKFCKYFKHFMTAIMGSTNTTVVSVEDKDAQLIILKISVILKIRNEKKVLHLLHRGRANHLDMENVLLGVFLNIQVLIVSQLTGQLVHNIQLVLIWVVTLKMLK